MGKFCNDSLPTIAVHRLFLIRRLCQLLYKSSGSSCSKLTTSLVNVSLKFSNINITNTLLFFFCAKDSHIFSTKNNSVFVTLADICLTNLCLNDIVKLTML